MKTSTAVGLLVLAAILWVVSNMVLDNYRQAQAEQAVQNVLSSPQVANLQLQGIEAQTQLLCQAKGYSAHKCKQITGK